MSCIVEVEGEEYVVGHSVCDYLVGKTPISLMVEHDGLWR